MSSSHIPFVVKFQIINNTVQYTDGAPTTAIFRNHEIRERPPLKGEGVCLTPACVYLAPACVPSPGLCVPSSCA